MSHLLHGLPYLLFVAKMALGFALAIVGIFGAFIALLVLAAFVVLPAIMFERAEAFPRDYDVQIDRVEDVV